MMYNAKQSNPDKLAAYDEIQNETIRYCSFVRVRFMAVVQGNKDHSAIANLSAAFHTAVEDSGNIWSRMTI